MSLAIRAPNRQPTILKSAVSPKAPIPRSPPLDETTLERLAKLVPADVMGVYLAARSITLSSEGVPSASYQLPILIGGAVLVPVLLALDARFAKESVSVVQYVVRTLAFVAWGFAIDPLGIPPIVSGLIGLVLPLVGERLLRSPA